MGLLDIFKNKTANDEGPIKQFGKNGENLNSSQIIQSKNKFCLIIIDVFQIVGRGTVVTGKVKYGTLYVGDNVFINKDKQAKVLGIEKYKQKLTEAHEGDVIGILLKIEYKLVHRGDIIEK